MSNLTQHFGLLAASASSVSGRPRHGVVTAVDPTTHSVKVTIQPEGIVSGWIPDPGLACSGLRISCPAETGTQVLLVPVEGDAEHPVIVARLFDTTVQAPKSPFTNKPVQPGEIGIFLADGTALHVTNGSVSIKGALHVEGGINATGDVTANGISLDHHVHGGVVAGNSLTTAPESGT